MGWKETCAMEERMKFIHEWQQRRRMVVCRTVQTLRGEPRKTGYKWRDRYERDGIAGLTDRAASPHAHPNQVSQRVTDALIEARQKHTRWGAKSCGPG